VAPSEEFVGKERGEGTFGDGARIGAACGARMAETKTYDGADARRGREFDNCGP